MLLDEIINEDGQQVNSPVETETTPEQVTPMTPAEQAPKKQKATPRNDSDTLAVVQGVIAKWDDTVMPLLWMEKSRLVSLAADFSSLLMNRNTTGASRGAITSALRKLDDEIDENIEHIKNRLAERLESKDEAVARYREFGIVKERAYKLPLSREHRVGALLMLANAVGVYQFEGSNFGVQYWTTMHTRYEQLVQQARATDGNVSSKVGSLNGMRSEIRKFLNAFILLVRASYPVTWKNELRNFGFQKEKY